MRGETFSLSALPQFSQLLMQSVTLAGSGWLACCLFLVHTQALVLEFGSRQLGEWASGLCCSCKAAAAGSAVCILSKLALLNHITAVVNFPAMVLLLLLQIRPTS